MRAIVSPSFPWGRWFAKWQCRYWSGTHINTKDSYVACIAAMIKKLNLNKPIVCGASMAGQISLACAVRAKEVGCVGTIALQGSDYLNMDRQFNDKSPYVNQSLFNPEWIYGMMSPTAPLKNRQLIWHMYSAEAYGIFHGDLDFYFGGWDGRSRMAGIDTKVCPVYMVSPKVSFTTGPIPRQCRRRRVTRSPEPSIKP